MDLERNWKSPKSPEKVEAFSKRLDGNKSMAFPRETTRTVRKTTSSDFEKKDTSFFPDL